MDDVNLPGQLLQPAGHDGIVEREGAHAAQ
jgi:hypothetical protein